MPPQQSDRPLDVFNEALGFCAHGPWTGSVGASLNDQSAGAQLHCALAAGRFGTKIELTGAVLQVRAKFLAAIAAVIFFSAPPAVAETLTQTLESFGFFGRWAIDCNEPPSASNTVRTVRISPTGDPTFSESLGGEGEPNVYVVLRAKPTSANTINLRIKLNGQDRQDLTMHRDDNRIRTLSNRDVETGEFIVRKGTIAGTRQATPWLTRCEQELPVRERS
jgi:hypothetical protein